MAENSHRTAAEQPNPQEQRRRARRPWWLAAGCLVVIVAALVGSLVVRADHTPQAGHQPRLAAAESSTSTSVSTSTSARPATTTPAGSVAVSPVGEQTSVTPAALLYRLQQLLPAGQTSGFGGRTDGSTLAQVYLDTGQGPGMVRLEVAPQTVGDVPDCTSTADDRVVCERLPDGALAVVDYNVGNCIQSMVVSIDHPNGSMVQLSVGTCLAWNGTANPPGGPALTQDQAVKIADDPSWGLTMSAALVAAAQRKFPHLQKVS